jgi:hypothetical protein
VTLDGPRIEVDPAIDALAVLLKDRHPFALESVPLIFIQNFKSPPWLAKPIDLSYDAIGVSAGQDGSGVTPNIVQLSLERTGAHEDSIRLQ